MEIENQNIPCVLVSDAFKLLTLNLWNQQLRQLSNSLSSGRLVGGGSASKEYS